MPHGANRTRAAVIAVTAALFTLALAAPAFAHVTVHPEKAEQGGWAKLTFRAPTERDDASTTKLQVNFPPEHPIQSVSVEPHQGWSYKVEHAKLDEPIKTEHGSVTETVSRITWTSDSKETAIKPGEFAEFAISAGPLPEADKLILPTVQTYSNGKVVKWIETAPEGSSEPEHPAPAVQLVSSSDANAASNTGNDADTAAAASVDGPDTGSSGPSGLTLTLSIVALVVALLGAAAAALAFLRTRRTS